MEPEIAYRLFPTSKELQKQLVKYASEMFDIKIVRQDSLQTNCVLYVPEENKIYTYFAYPMDDCTKISLSDLLSMMLNNSSIKTEKAEIEKKSPWEIIPLERTVQLYEYLRKYIHAFKNNFALCVTEVKSGIYWHTVYTSLYLGNSKFKRDIVKVNVKHYNHYLQSLNSDISHLPFVISQHKTTYKNNV